MSLVKNISYTSAGRQARPFERMIVRSNVRVPDSEAGAEQNAAQGAYQAPVQSTPAQRVKPTIPLYMAALILGLAVCMIGMGVIARNAEKAQIAKSIDELYSEIANTRKQCADLTETLAEAHDSSYVCYYAAHTLQMKATDESETVYIIAPDTRPNDTKALDALSAQIMGYSAER